MSDLKRRHIYEWLHLVETKIGTPTAASAARVLKEFYEGAELDEGTQPEANAPAQDLSAAILAIPLPETCYLGGDEAYGDRVDGYTADQMRDLLKAAAALASSANALSAGDRVDALIDLLRKALEASVIGRGSYGLNYDGNLLARDIRAAILQSQKGGSDA